MSAPVTRDARPDVTSDPFGPVLTLRDVSVVHGGRRAVNALTGVSGDLPYGAQLAIEGQSGSGKSTLVHVMAGLQRLSGGAVSWPSLGGAQPRDLPGVVGVVFQSPSLLPPLDALENVALPLLLRGVPQDEATARAHDALELLGLTTISHQLPEELSGGQSQRVAIARALVTRPLIVLADEPTGQLDHDTASRVLDLMIDQVEAVGAALVVSTHDTAVADRLPLRWSMNDGQLTVEEST